MLLADDSSSIVSAEEMMYSVTFIGVLSICLGGSLSKQLVKIKGNWLTKAGLEMTTNNAICLLH